MSHVLIICSRQFNGHELYTALDVLDARGHTFEIVSTDYVIQDMDTGEPFRIDKTINDIAIYWTQDSGLLVIDGDRSDTELLWNNSGVRTLVEGYGSEMRPIAAIGIAVPTIRSAIPPGTGVSFFPLLVARELITGSGAVPSRATVTRDHYIVTGEHGQSAEMVLNELCNLLEGTIDQTYVVISSEFKPDGRKPRPVDLIDKIKALKAQKESQKWV